MKIIDVTSYLETMAPAAWQEDYDNSGLLYGDHQWEVTAILLCLDLTPAVMTEAISKKCNLVIAHHPFIFRGLKKLTPSQPETAILTLAIQHGIGLYAFHTNLDNSLKGLNAWILQKLGATDFQVLRPLKGILAKLVTFCPESHAAKVRQALFNAGSGELGNYSHCSFNLEGQGTFKALEGADPYVGRLNEVHFENELRIEVIYPKYREKNILKQLLNAHPYEEVAYDIYNLDNTFNDAGSGVIASFREPVDPLNLLQSVRDVMQIPVLRHTEIPEKKIRTIAICTGSGSFLIADAVGAGAQVMLTADIKYHEFFDFAEKILLVDIGHYESEQHVKEWLHAALIEKFPNFAVLISETNTNPVHYLEN